MVFMICFKFLFLLDFLLIQQIDIFQIDINQLFMSVAKSSSKNQSSDMEDPHGKDQHHNTFGEYIKSAVYGGLDGLCTTLIIVVAAFGNSSQAGKTLALGIASMIGDGLGMAAADYLGTKSDGEYMEQQQKRQRQQIENDLEAQKAEMVHLYTEMGLQPAVSSQIVQIISKNKEGFLKIMMIEELQLIAGQQNPITNSIVTFFSFALFGFMPILPTVIAKAGGAVNIEQGVLIATICVSVFFLGVIGLAKSLIGGMKWYISVFETIIIGAIAASVSYGIGTAFG